MHRKRNMKITETELTGVQQRCQEHMRVCSIMVLGNWNIHTHKSLVGLPLWHIKCKISSREIGDANIRPELRNYSEERSLYNSDLRNDFSKDLKAQVAKAKYTNRIISH